MVVTVIQKINDNCMDKVSDIKTKVWLFSFSMIFFFNRQPWCCRQLFLWCPAGWHHPHCHWRTLWQHAWLYDSAGTEEAQGKFSTAVRRNKVKFKHHNITLFDQRTQTTRACRRRHAASQSRPTTWHTTQTTCHLLHSLPVTTGWM